MASRASLGALPAGTYTSPTGSWSACTVCWDSVITALSAGQTFMDTTAAVGEGGDMAVGTGKQDTPNENGRGSWRGRGENSVVGGSIKKKKREKKNDVEEI